MSEEYTNPGDSAEGQQPPDTPGGREIMGVFHFEPPKDAIWHHPNGQDVPVKVMQSHNEGRSYVLEGKWGFIPADQIDFDPPSFYEEPEQQSDVQEDYKPGEPVSLWQKGKLRTGYIVDEQDGLYGDFVKIKKKDGTKDGVYAPPEILIRAETETTEKEAQQEEVAEEAGEIATEQVVKDPDKPKVYKYGEVEKVPLKGGEKSAKISKTGQEVVVVEDIVKDDKPYVRLASGREIPKEDIEYPRWSDDFEGSEFIHGHGDDELIYKVVGQGLEFSTQYKDGIKYVYLEGFDKNGQLKTGKARPRELVQQTSLPQGYWRKVEPKTEKAENVQPEEVTKKEEKEAPKTNPEKQKPEFKFQEGETVKVRTRDGKRVFDWVVKTSFIDKEGRALVWLKHPDPESKYPDRRVPQDQLEIENPRPSKQENKTDNQPKEDKAASPDNADSGDGGSKNNNPEVAHEYDENSWLDPRRIQELKSQYEEALSAYGGHISEEAKDNLKKIIIEREIARAIRIAERVKKIHKVGLAPEEPDDTVKEKMAEMMDEPFEKINEMAQERDDLVLEQASAFKKGQDVKIIKHDGNIEDGWKIEGYSYSPNAKPMVRITKGKYMRMIDAETLRQYQEVPDPGSDQANLELLKPYFDKNVKIKVDDRIIEAKFTGISLNGGVYADIDIGPLLDSEGKPRLDEDGNPRRRYDKVLINDVNEFLDWQNERLTAEVEEEENAKRIAEMRAKITPFIGKEVRVENEKGNPVPGYKCVEYLEDHEMVKISNPDHPNPEFQDTYISAEQFLEWQEKAEQEKWDKVPPFKKGMEITIASLKPDGSTEEVQWTVEDAIENNGAMHIIIKNGGGAETKKSYAELKQLLDNGGRPIEPSIPSIPIERPPVPRTLDEMMGGDKEYRTWYERIKKQYNKLDRYEKYGNYYKLIIGFLGAVALTPAVGLAAGTAIGIQHRRHYARINAKIEKEIRDKEKEKKLEDKKEVVKLPKEHVATI